MYFFQLEQVLKELDERTQVSDRLLSENAEYELQLTTLKEQLVNVRTQLSDTHSQVTWVSDTHFDTYSQVTCISEAHTASNASVISIHQAQYDTQYDT